MTWPQNYTPLHGLLPSALVATVPLVVLLVLLGVCHVRAHLAAVAGLATALGIATVCFKMPVVLAVEASGYGALFGLFPIGWIVLNAIFIYQISVDTGEFEVLKAQIARLSDDRRIQALLIAFSFGAFIEGCAGFGTPVAICGAMLLGLGFKPLEAAKLALIGNTAPVAFGGLGLPVTTLSSVTGLDLHLLSAMVGRQLPVFSLLIPFGLTMMQAGWRGMIEIWPACLVSGLTFAGVQFALSNFHGPWLVDIVCATASMLALVGLLRVWQPPIAAAAVAMPATGTPGRQTFRVWLPWVLLSLFVVLWSVPAWKQTMDQVGALKFRIQPLHLAVQRMPPVVPHAEPEKAEFIFNWLSATGTALFCAGVATGLLLGIRPTALAQLYGRCIWRVRVSLLTIALMLALGFTTRFSGLDTTAGLAFAQTGAWFPFFSPLLGWLGVALTGSDTSSNVLFGNLQRTTAEQLGISPILTAAANSSGGVMGKMIDAQSIMVASVAIGGAPDSPSAGAILRAVFWYSLALAMLVGVLVWVQAHFPAIIPTH